MAGAPDCLAPTEPPSFDLSLIGETRILAVSRLRASTEEQASKGGRDEGFSAPAQREMSLRTGQDLGPVVIEEFIDAGGSARKADRLALTGTIEYVKTNPIAYCFVYKVDRLALVGNAHKIYMGMDDSLRRIAKQAFFERLLVTDDGIDGQAGRPFKILFAPAMHENAAPTVGRRQSMHIKSAMSSV